MIRALSIFAVTYALMNARRSTIAAGVLTPCLRLAGFFESAAAAVLRRAHTPRKPLLLLFGALFVVVAGLDRSGLLRSP